MQLIKPTFILDVPDAFSELSSGTSCYSCMPLIPSYVCKGTAEVARPPASAHIIMQRTEHQDFQLMPVRGEFIENSSILAKPGKDLFRCRSVYISKATGKATDMMRVARAMVTVLGTVEIVDTPIAHLRKLPGALCMRKEGTSSVQDDAVEQRALGEEPCQDAVHHFIALRLVKAGNHQNSQGARINGHEPAVAIWLPFAVRPRLSGVFLVQGVAFHMHLGMAVAHNLRTEGTHGFARSDRRLQSIDW